MQMPDSDGSGIRNPGFGFGKYCWEMGFQAEFICLCNGFVMLWLSRRSTNLLLIFGHGFLHFWPNLFYKVECAVKMIKNAKKKLGKNEENLVQKLTDDFSILSHN